MPPPPNYPDWLFPTAILYNRTAPHRQLWVRAILAEVSGNMSVQVFEISTQNSPAIRRILMTASLGVIMLTCEPLIVQGSQAFLVRPRSTPPDLLDENGLPHQAPSFEDWLAGRHFGPPFPAIPGAQFEALNVDHTRSAIDAIFEDDPQVVPPSPIPLTAEESALLDSVRFGSTPPEPETPADPPMTVHERIMLDDELG